MFEFLISLGRDGFLPVFFMLLKFSPTVVLLLIAVSVFENSGIILGFGCTTLAVANQQICKSNPADMAYAKKLVRFLTFVPCSGKLPVLAFLCGLVFGVSAFGVLYFYIVSVFLGILLCGFAVRRPKLKSMSFLAFVRIVIANIFDFFKRVSIGICTAVTVLFTLQYFGLLVPIAKIFTPILAPIGLAFPFAVIALAFGIAGKEMVIGAVMTFSAAFAEMSTLSSVSFILFVLLYPPCFAALVAIRDKFGARFALSTIAFNLFVAYVVSFIVYNVATVILMC